MALNGNSTSPFKYPFELRNDKHSLLLKIISFYIYFFFSPEEIYFCPSMVSPSLFSIENYFIRNSSLERKDGIDLIEMDSWMSTSTDFILPPSFLPSVDGNVLIVSFFTVLWFMVRMGSRSVCTGEFLEETTLEEPAWNPEQPEMRKVSLPMARVGN